jgi:hypothetical protein
LPVRNTRFPAFAEALGWLPSSFQEFAPLRSIVTNATMSHEFEEAQARTCADAQAWVDERLRQTPAIPRSSRP